MRALGAAIAEYCNIASEVARESVEQAATPHALVLMNPSIHCRGDS